MRTIKKGYKSVKNIFTGLYSFLLFSLLLLFIFRPSDRGGVYISIWQFIFVVIVASAIFNSNHKTFVKIAASFFAIPCLIFNWLSLYYMENTFYLGVYLVCAFTFIFICATSIINQVVLHAKVTIGTLKGVIAAYFLVGFGFAFTYYFIELLQSGSFSSLFPEKIYLSHSEYISEMMYFSFVSLLTLGFGDIVPLHPWSRTIVVVEGIIGQFYIAILVARLVAVYSFYSDKPYILKPVEKKEQE